MRRTVCWWATLWALGPGHLSGQVVQVRVVDSATRAAAPSALVSLLGADGAIRARRLTDLQGMVQVLGVEPGRYRLEVSRIGSQTATVGPFTLSTARDTVRHRVALAPRQLVLPDMNVVALDVACDARGVAGTASAEVWAEARKALSVVLLTEESVRPLVWRWRWEQILNRRRQPRDSARSVASYTREPPFRSSGSAEIRDDGFIEVRGSRAVFQVPDARMLLDDSFLETHCFRLDVESRRAEGLVGLRFVPLAGRTVPEINGTLWLDRGGADLREVTFEYVNVPEVLRVAGSFGGQVTFASVPGVGWIVNRWLVETPVIGVPERDVVSGRGTRSTRLGVVGWHVGGGEAEVVAQALEIVPGRRGKSVGSEAVGARNRVGPALLGCPDQAEGHGSVIVRVVDAVGRIAVPDVPVTITIGRDEALNVKLGSVIVRRWKPAPTARGTTDEEGLVLVCGIALGSEITAVLEASGGAIRRTQTVGAGETLLLVELGGR